MSLIVSKGRAAVFLSYIQAGTAIKSHVKFVIFMLMIFPNYESTFGLTDVPASIYDRKTAARPFDTIHDILRSLSLVQSLLKDRNSPNWRHRAPTHMNLSGTEGLSH